MINNNHFEKDNFKTLIESDDIGRVEDRLNVIDTFLSTEEHVTLEEFMALLKERGFSYTSDFVRLCLNRWVEQGFAQKKHFEGQPPRYEHHHLGKHHDHLICTKCGKIIEFHNNDLERLQMKIAMERQFHMLQHKMEIYGLCAECMTERSPLMPLDSARTGERVIIKEIIGGRAVKGRLASMGFRSGDVLEIINNEGQGRLIIGHGNTRLAIGRGMATNLIVALESFKQRVPNS
jgi:Fur family ferric uptake transcriptional regulator